MNNTLLEVLKILVANEPNKRARDYLNLLKEKGFLTLTKKDINSLFYSNKHIFLSSLIDDVPYWRLKENLIDKGAKLDNKNISKGVLKKDLELSNSSPKIPDLTKLDDCSKCKYANDQSCSRAIFNIICEEFKRVK